VWWCTPVIPALGRLRQEYQEFEASLSYIVDPDSKKKKKTRKLNSICKGTLLYKIDYYLKR
jgi:hypothetical protein